ncbi:UDP-N-acetylenolpyruvoylglucosamine reductase [Candidatus Woesebacteria bacterium RIFCSPLOWO2_01_FULL_43_11]|nr:MAG: UDP-N-acetylenolpyruvoylglucosamine reductase [Candidatus Woesebacteria bacterium RIFCSPLOWO2_01_FULL_43_11]
MKKLEEFIKENRLKGFKSEPMSKHTTLQIGGPSKMLIEVSGEETLLKLLQELIPQEKFIVIGEGSDLLVSDKGYDGVVIVNRVEGISKENGHFEIKAGTSLAEFIDFVNRSGSQGIESMAGIPGTVGGAIYGNAGAYGQAICDHLKSVKFFKDGKVVIWKKRRLRFSYRESVFKGHKSWIILSATFQFPKGKSSELVSKSKEIIAMRAGKYPEGVRCPGSFFKNVLLKDVSAESLKRIPEDKIIFGKIPSGYLMQSVGAIGARKGRVEIAEYHGNLIINLGGGKAKDFIDLANFYRDKVEKKFGIKLEPEVQLIGFN